MNTYLINFQNIEWQSHGPSARSKEYIRGNQRIRMVEFLEGFIESEWCSKGHLGYIIEGSFSIDFSEKIIRFKTGDVLFIPNGSQNKHKAVLGKGEKVLIILFETI